VMGFCKIGSYVSYFTRKAWNHDLISASWVARIAGMSPLGSRLWSSWNCRLGWCHAFTESGRMCSVLIHDIHRLEYENMLCWRKWHDCKGTWT
jgi:hypothetical protein